MDCPDLSAVTKPKPVHASRIACFRCELPNLLRDSMPPDPEMVDLIEQAFLEGQIDSLKCRSRLSLATQEVSAVVCDLEG